MAGENGSGYSSSAPSEAHARLLYQSLEKYNKEQMSRRRPSVILAALISLFLSSVGGVTLAIVLMIKVVEKEAGCLSRDLILFAAIISMFYIGLHIRGARKDYKREVSGPPQLHGQYLYATALLIARLGICVWVAALIATAILMARAVPFQDLSKTVPILNLLICTGAIPSFIIISITIEKNPFPFATTAISSNSFLTCQVSEFADDLTADLSVSRRASLQRKQNQPNSGSIVTLSTEDIFKLGIRKFDEKAVSSPAPNPTTVPEYIVPRSPKMPEPARSPQALPQPTYYPGGWRVEWDSVPQEICTSRTAESSVSVPTSTSLPHSNTSTEASTSSSSSSSSHYESQQGVPPLSTTTVSSPPLTHHSSLQIPPKPYDNYTIPNSTTNNAQQGQQGQQHLSRATASTSIASSAARSNLSTVRYASEPELAVRQPMKVVWNPARSTSSTLSDQFPSTRVVDPLALLRGAQQAHRSMGTETGTPVGPMPMPMPMYGSRSSSLAGTPATSRDSENL